MIRRKDERVAHWPWSVPLVITDVPEEGKHVDLVADERARTAIAKLAGLRDVSRLAADFDIALRGRDGLRIVGRVSGTVGQTCVVTLEPVDNEIEEDIDLVFASSAVPVAREGGIAAQDGPEPLIDGTVDLGAIATEFVLLALDPYPRKPGAVFEAPSPARDDETHPFAALAALKKGPPGEGN
jgi:uncharacterized metal-binding protein YceD (DUF177 family)